MSNEENPAITRDRYYLELGAVPESMTFYDIWIAITSSKKIITFTTMVFLLLGVLAIMMMPVKYKAEVVVAEANAASKTTTTSTDSISLDVAVEASEALAMVESRQFLTAFIEENNLIPILYAKDWDADSKQWKETVKDDPPTLWDAFDKFGDDVLDVETDTETGLTTISILWTDPALAAEWANKIVDRVNEKIRLRAIAEAEKTLAFLNAEIAKTSSVEIIESLYELVKTEKAIVVAANVHDEYAFKIFDPAVVPEEQSIPYLQAIILGVCLLLGTFFGVTIVLLVHVITASRSAVKHD